MRREREKDSFLKREMTQQWKPHPTDFDLPNAIPIGAGAISQVYRCRHRESGKLAAVKILSKVQLLQQKKVEAVMGEKAIHYRLGPHPFICRLMGTAQSDDELYFILEYLDHGDLLQHIRTVSATRRKEKAMLLDQKKSNAAATYMKCLDFHDIRFIAAQLVLALEQVFANGCCLRDLKPENVCFDSCFRCCIIDFDTAVFAEKGVSDIPVTNDSIPVKEEPQLPRRKSVSEIQQMRKKSANFCGTAQYVSPEMVGEVRWSYSSDLWALGVVVYQMLYGVHPFQGSSSFAVMKELLQGLVERHFAELLDLGPVVESAATEGSTATASAFDIVKSFIVSLVRLDPTQRLGVHPETKEFDPAAVRSHPLFDGFDWSVLERQVEGFTLIGPETYFSSNSEAQTPTGGTTSLAPYYHSLPCHSDDYAKYVFSATDESNPFDQWVQCINQQREKCDEAVSSQPPAPQEDSADLKSSSSEPSSDNHDDEFSDDEDDVIDDVGMMQVSSAHPDFTATHPDFTS